MGIVQDMRYALRVLLKNSAFTAVAIITLALGIGVNATVFSVVNTYLFKPLPVKDAGQLVAIAGKSRSFEFPLQVSYGDYKDIAGQATVFSGALAYEDDPVNMSFGGSPQRIWTELVTGNYFSLLGIDATIGRTFTPEEGRFPGGAPVMVLSYNFWEKQFGGDRSAVGRTVRLDGSAFTIIGVAPQSFRGTFALISPDAYVPAGSRGLLFEEGDQVFATRSSNPLRLIARLNSGVSVDQAQAALGVLANQLQQQYPDTNRDLSFITVPETRSRPVLEVASTFDKISLIFMILVGLVLLIACANVANLMLARATARQKELAIRNALGASRSSLVRLFLSEALLLSFAGGIFGLLLGYWASRYMSGLQFSMGAPISFHFSIDMRVFFFTAAAVLTTTLLAGLLPAIRASRPDISETLKEGGRGNSGDGGWQRLRSALVGGQVAVSMFLLIAGALFIRSMQAAQHANLGFRTSHVLLGDVDLSLQRYDQARGERFYKNVIDRVRQLPGVKSATLSYIVPFGGNNDAADVATEEHAADPKHDIQVAFFNCVGPDYFKTMGVSILEGRAFNTTDDKSAPQVALVSQAMAHALWPNQDPLGRRFKFGRNGPLLQVVGVTADEKHIFINEDPRPFFYRPLAQLYEPFAAIELYTEGDAANLTSGFTEAVHEVDPDLPLYDITTMESHLSNGLAFFFVRAGAIFAAIFGLLALILATVGIYGVVSYSVSRRAHEIGIRMALGASRGQVLSMIFRQGFLIVGIGLVLGLGMAAAASKAISSLLFGVHGFDPLTFVTVSIMLSAIAALAIYIPAFRAARTHPSSALRYE